GLRGGTAVTGGARSGLAPDRRFFLFLFLLPAVLFHGRHGFGWRPLAEPLLGRFDLGLRLVELVVADLVGQRHPATLAVLELAPQWGAHEECADAGAGGSAPRIGCAAGRAWRGRGRRRSARGGRRC